jgi:methylmalonyl-CoA/ethylmalonyl-CoA epimerase
MKIHHIGYLVGKPRKALDAFLALGYTLQKDFIYDDYRKAQIGFLEKDGYVIELVSPVEKDSVVADLKKKLGNTAYHICYEVEDLEKTAHELEAQHYVLCSEIHGAIALDGRRVCFYVHPYMGMVELLEKGK